MQVTSVPRHHRNHRQGQQHGTDSRHLTMWFAPPRACGALRGTRRRALQRRALPRVALPHGSHSRALRARFAIVGLAVVPRRFARLSLLPYGMQRRRVANL